MLVQFPILKAGDEELELGDRWWFFLTNDFGKGETQTLLRLALDDVGAAQL